MRCGLEPIAERMYSAVREPWDARTMGLTCDIGDPIISLQLFWLLRQLGRIGLTGQAAKNRRCLSLHTGRSLS
jgi:hypothetical protein